MTAYDKALAARIAEELIANITARVAPRAMVLEKRIQSARAYMDEVNAPNTHTLTHVHRHLSGEYDDLPMSDYAAPMQELFSREWWCEVNKSGYHNGVYCDPSDPHDGRWSCGYRWTTAPMTDEEARKWGLVAIEELTT
jgi:hypothetical protein